MTMTTPTETPRTDAVFWKFHTHEDLVNLAKDLEHELSESKAEVEFWKIKAHEAEHQEGTREAMKKLEVSENEIRMKQDSIVAAVNLFIQEYPSDRASVYLAPIMEKLFSK